ncbi:tetratricopeptide repeat protein [Shewanella sp. MF05960]|uniref:tetratricopeptide repeat protein n=1 Tax=Shewanella sp. MF05960 TaxID=3434874 RepID=UPI003D7A3DC6
MPQAPTSNTYKYFSAVIILLLIGIGAYVYLSNIKPKPLASGTVLVLPVKIVTPPTDGDTQWNAYAAMDVLIHQLTLGVSYPLLQAEDVINITSRLAQTDNVSPSDINKIMAISGAVLVIESSVSMLNNQYQLSYTLHSQSQSDSTSISADSINQALASAAKAITHQLNPKHKQSVNDYHSQLHSTQLVQAITLSQQGDLLGAEQLLSEVIQDAPNNLLASRLLGNIQLQQQQFEQLNSTLTAAMGIAEHQNEYRELAQLRLLLAQSYIETNKIEQALGVLNLAKTNAAKVKDWLTLGYIYHLAGTINQRIGRNNDAREQFKKAIEYHQMMGYPIGQSQTLNDLAELEVVEFNYPQAYRLINRSYELVAHRGLDDLENTTFKIMSNIENKMQHR